LTVSLALSVEPVLQFFCDLPQAYYNLLPAVVKTTTTVSAGQVIIQCDLNPINKIKQRYFSNDYKKWYMSFESDAHEGDETIDFIHVTYDDVNAFLLGIIDTDIVIETDEMIVSRKDITSKFAFLAYRVADIDAMYCYAQ